MIALILLLIATGLADKISVYESFDGYDDETSSPVIDAINEIRIDGSQNHKKGNEDDGSYDGTWIDTIPGRVGNDYPAYSTIPKTNFNCRDRKASGYYADVDAGCQVFHICLDQIHKISFLCPNGSIFNQKVLVCDWWYDVDCQSAAENPEAPEVEQFVLNDFALSDIYDLNLASSGGNQDPKQTEAPQKRLSQDNIKENDYDATTKKGCRSQK